MKTTNECWKGTYAEKISRLKEKSIKRRVKRLLEC